MRRTITALIAAAAICAFASPAAASVEGARSMTVSYADLDLTTDRGAKSMLRRINRAERDVRGMSSNALMTVSQRREGRACVRETTEQTIAEMARPTVTALYVERTGRQPR